jgi:hypothetical protein
LVELHQASYLPMEEETEKETDMAQEINTSAHGPEFNR